MLVSYIYVNVYIKWFWLHQYTPWVVLIILMHISHNIMLYKALLKIRIVIKSIRIFHMIPVMQTHAYFVHVHHVSAARVCEMTPLGPGMCLCACAGIRNCTHQAYSFFRSQAGTKRGCVVSGTRFQAQTHTRWQLGGGRCPEPLGSLNCLIVHMIFNTEVVLVIMIYYIVVMC